jgi:hypothetical protein
MSELFHNTLSTDQFTYNKERREYVSEISDFGPSFRFDRIYDDAADRGFTLQSRTGKVANFYVDDVKKDNDGDIMYWTLLPTDETVRRNPNLKGVKITIIND